MRENARYNFVYTKSRSAHKNTFAGKNAKLIKIVQIGAPLNIKSQKIYK